MTAAIVAPHHHSPSTMHMGDCSICGNTADAPQHIAAKPAKPKPLDLSTLLRHAFLSGRGLKENDNLSPADQAAWMEYDPTEMKAFNRITGALDASAGPIAAAVALVDKHLEAAKRCKDEPLYKNGVPMGILIQDLQELRESVAALGDRKARQPGQPLRVEVEGGRLTISIGIGTLAFAVQHADNQWPEDIYISDPYEFAKDVSRVLSKESEDGTTPIHVMLDKAAVEAADQGSDGSDYGSVSEGIEIARGLIEKRRR